jgi:hypothetical protein
VTQFNVLLDDGSEVAIFANSRSEAVQEAVERGLRAAENELSLQWWAQQDQDDQFINEGA